MLAPDVDRGGGPAREVDSRDRGPVKAKQLLHLIDEALVHIVDVERRADDPADLGQDGPLVRLVLEVGVQPRIGNSTCYLRGDALDQRQIPR